MPGDRWNTLKVVCDGGMIQNVDSLTLGEAQMGAAERLVNFEGDINGGYKRIKGYALYNNRIASKRYSRRHEDLVLCIVELQDNLNALNRIGL